MKYLWDWFVSDSSQVSRTLHRYKIFIPLKQPKSESTNSASKTASSTFKFFLHISSTAVTKLLPLNTPHPPRPKQILKMSNKTAYSLSQGYKQIFVLTSNLLCHDHCSSWLKNATKVLVRCTETTQLILCIYLCTSFAYVFPLVNFLLFTTMAPQSNWLMQPRHANEIKTKNR